MKNEWAAFSADLPLSFRNKQCSHCQKETLHRGVKCGVCGLMSKIGHEKAGSWNGASGGYKRLRIIQQSNADKRAAFSRAAEASRKKFET